MRTAIITGATHGIGRAIAEKFLAEGYAVITCARNTEELHALRDMWETKWPHAHIHAVGVDVGIKDEVMAFAQFVLDNAETIDVLVNNAGTFLQGDVSTEPDGQLEQMMNVNLFSAYHLTRALLPRMKSQGQGNIFNLCSVASLKAYPGGGSYSITKYALLGFSENLRYELREHGIRVTALCPGATWSRSWSSSGVLRERIMESEDVATMVWAICNLSDKADVETVIMRPMLGDL